MIEIKRIKNSDVDSALKTPGGFAWWYADVVDTLGNGFVLIWSLGLPFLAGSRDKPIASERPALNLVTYRGGRPDFYLLQEYPAEACHIDPLSGAGTMGGTKFEVKETSTHVELRVRIDADVPYSQGRVVGELEVNGARLHLPDGPTTAKHQWSPRTTCARGALSLRHDGKHTNLRGSAYFDANFSSLSLHEQGIDSWRWGRLSFEEETLVYYDITHESGARTRHVFLQGAEGEGQQTLLSLPVHEFASRQEKRGAYGVTAPREITLETPLGFYTARCRHLVDDGPFYQRFLLDGSGPEGRRGHGIAEVVIPSRVDLPWQRPFVRMRTHRLSGENSPFLPLFSGPSAHRVSRLFRSLTLGGAA